MTPKRPIFLAHAAFAHHGTRSGYAQVLAPLADSGEETRLLNLPTNTGLFSLPSQWRRVRGSIKGASVTCHLYSEQTLLPLTGGGRVVAVCHQPPRQLLRVTPRVKIYWKTLRSADLVIGLGPAQTEWLCAQGIETVFVPHGVDLDTFSPGDSASRESPFLLTVAGWLREDGPTQTLLGSIRTAGYRIRSIGGRSPRVSDDVYLGLLRDCQAVVLEIDDAVASNSVLEAAAVGKPIVGKLSPDSQWYISAENRSFLRLPVERQLAALECEGAKIGRANRSRVMTLSWEEIAGALREAVYSLR